MSDRINKITPLYNAIVRYDIYAYDIESWKKQPELSWSPGKNYKQIGVIPQGTSVIVVKYDDYEVSPGFAIAITPGLGIVGVNTYWLNDEMNNEG